MNIPCPCCKAPNTATPCRRCKADLSLLFDLEAGRTAEVASATRALQNDDPTTALTHLGRAEALRAGEDVRRLTAVAHLWNRDFLAAFARYSTPSG